MTHDKLPRWLFLRLVGVVYLSAIVSLWVQIHGLIGSEGILPLGDYLDWIRENLGVERYHQVPTLFWFGHGDLALDLVCGFGVVLSLLLIGGVAPIPVLFVLWAVYLSLAVAGQRFLSFQWDILLLETGFMAMFFAPWTFRPRSPWREPRVSRAGLWLMRFLLFKLMFLSGIVKLISLDHAWWELTALDFHYYTQPLPAWTSWYAHQLPSVLQKLSVLVMFVIELVLPFLIFFGRRMRIVAFVGLVFLQLLIAATGNYGFFNLLTVVLCVPLLDDRLLGVLLPESQRSELRVPHPPRPRHRSYPRWIGTVLVRVVIVFLLLSSGMTVVREMVRTRPTEGIDGVLGALFDGAETHLLSWGQPYLLEWSDPFRTISGYGLFRAMTTARPEIVVEGSLDGQTWREYEFRFKPGDVSRPPRFVQPHMPRLDWQMWFAALDPRRAGGHWLQGLSKQLLRGSPDVLGLLDVNPFPDEPPRYMRWVYYEYKFSEGGDDWWTREHKGVLAGPFSLEAFKR